MKILIVPDSFKESLSATKVAEAISEGILSVHENLEIEQLPFSDGGEGAFELLGALGLGEPVTVDCQDPMGRPYSAPYFLFFDQKTAWVELSQASGLALLKENEQNPLNTSTYGTGIQISHALEKGVRRIFLGIGGSATHDVASGIFCALGGRIFDKNKKVLAPSGQALIKCASINSYNLDPALNNTHITVACDVTNPLLGKNGAAKTYAAQKGANKANIEKLEKATKKYAALLEKEFQRDIRTIQGGGAAGGVAAGIHAFTGADLKPGFGILSELAELEIRIQKADIIITGEGKTDQQSKFGKLPFKIANLAKKYQKEMWLLAGDITVEDNELREAGFTKTAAIKPKDMPLEQAKCLAYELLKDKASSLLRKN